MKSVVGYSDLLVSEDGAVWSKSLNRFLSQSGSKDSYLKVTTKKDNRREPTRVGVHVLVCLAFNGPPPKDGIARVANHIDGNKRNNHRSNLEWATYSENNKHAWANFLNRGGSKKVLYKNYVTGEVREFRSIRQCAREGLFSRPRALISLKTGQLVNGRILVGSGETFPTFSDEEIQESVRRYSATAGHEIMVKNHITGETKKYSKISHFFDDNLYTGITPQAINVRLTFRRLWPVNGFSFKYAFVEDAFPELDEHQIEYSFDPKFHWGVTREIFVTDTVSGKISRYGGRRRASEALAIPMSKIQYYLEKHGGLLDNLIIEERPI